MIKMQRSAGFLLFLIFVCLVHPCIGYTGDEMVVVFKGDETEVPYTEDNGTIRMRKPRAFRVPAFVGGVINNKEFLAVICDARYNGFSDWSFIELAARTSYGDYKNWSAAEIIAKNTRKSPKHSVVGDATAVMKGNEIYVLAPSWDSSPYSWGRHTSNSGWTPLMIVGTVENNTESDDGGVSVKWENGTSLKSLLPHKMLGAEVFQFIGGVGNGMVTKNGTIVFPINMVSTSRKSASSVMYSNDGENWILGETTPQGPTECSVVEFNGGKWILTCRYNGIGVRPVYESHDMGKTWKESLMFSRVWGNAQTRRGVGSQGSAITVPIDGEDVLLFSHPLNKRGGYSRDTLQLWLSNGNRIMCVGTISEAGKGERSGYSILAHVGDKLYIAHEINPFGEWNNYHAKLKKWDRIIAISPLPHFFDGIKETVHAWRELDKKLQMKGIPSDVLVGFLGNNTHDTVWADMYNCVNATVKGGERVVGGFRFTAVPGSGAKWPVVSQGQNQVYIFTRHQFTLAATVIIHTTSGDADVSLIGASEDAYGTRVLLGLGYTKEKKWYAMQSNGNKVPTEVSFVLEKEYSVEITFTNGVASVYVDGVDITNGNVSLSSTALINHFFMGGIENTSISIGSSCTVKNVMLFSRALEKNEIARLLKIEEDKDKKAQKLTAKPQTVPQQPNTIQKTGSQTVPQQPNTIQTTGSQTVPQQPNTIQKTGSQTVLQQPNTIQITGSQTVPQQPNTVRRTGPQTVPQQPKTVQKTGPHIVLQKINKGIKAVQATVTNNTGKRLITEYKTVTKNVSAVITTESKTVTRNVAGIITTESKTVTKNVIEVLKKELTGGEECLESVLQAEDKVI